MNVRFSCCRTILVVAVLLLSESGALPEERVEGLAEVVHDGHAVVTAGPTKLGFALDRGVFLEFGGVPLLECSRFLARINPWRQVVDGLGRRKLQVRRELNQGVPEIVVRPAAGGGSGLTFAYRLRLVDPTRVVVRFYCRWEGEGPLSLTYCAGLLATNPTKGADYQAAVGKLERTGRLPNGLSTLPWLVQPFSFPFDRLIIDSRIGMVSIQVDSDRPFLFRRQATTTAAFHAGSMAFWMGWPHRVLEPGESVLCNFALGLPARPVLSSVTCHSGGGDVSGPPQPVTDALAPELTDSPLLPAPQQQEKFAENFVLRPDTRILTAADATAAEQRAPRDFQTYLRHRFKLALPLTSDASEGTQENCIVIGQPLLDARVAALCRREGLVVSAFDPGPEGYELIVRPGVVVVAGADAAGTYYGVQTLKQLVGVDADERCVIRGTRIRDWPDFGFRGVHLLADDYALQLHTRLIDNLLAPLKINNLILECEYARWDSHPELAQPWAMSKAEMRKLKDVAETHFMRITPLIQSLGHCEWMFAGGRHADLQEDPGQPYAYCPSNPKSYDLLFDIYKEVLDVFHPEYLHIGHDEVGNRGRFGSCPRCRGTPPAVLFADNVRRIHDFLNDHGVKTMMWGDMLLRPGEATDATHGGDPYHTGDARTAIPKDVVICDWHYSPYRDYPSARLFANEGFEVVGCTWHNQKNIYYFSRSAKQYGAVGLLQTTWTGHNGNRGALQQHPEQLYAYVSAAEFAWTAGKPALTDIPYRRGEVFRRCLFPRPAVLHRTPGFLVRLAPACNINLADNNVPGDWLGYGHLHDLRRLLPGRRRFHQILVDLVDPLLNGRRNAVMLRGRYTERDAFPTQVALPLHHRAQRLFFVHTTAWPVFKGQRVGNYDVVYVDGAVVSVPLVYGVNIHAWDDSTPSTSETQLWADTTLSGVPVSVGLFEWVNPHPHRVIERVVFRSAGTEASPVLLAVTGVNPSPAAAPPLTVQAPR